MVDDAGDTFLVFLRGFVKYVIEAVVEPTDERGVCFFLIFMMGFEEDGTQSGRQCKGVDGRNHNRDSHRHTELAVECTRGATHKRYRNEHGCHHEGDGDDSARNLIHGIQCGRHGLLIALIELGVHGLNHHNGVVDHNGDGQ